MHGSETGQGGGIAVKMEGVKKHLEQWGELIISTANGERYEIHLGDTTFDLENRVIRLTTPTAVFEIDGDSVEAIEKHYGHKEE